MLRINPGKVLIIAALFLSLTQQSQAEVVRTIAIVPQLSPTILAKQWQPLIQALSNQTGIQFRFITAPTVAEFERRLLNGDYDYAYMNAAIFLEARKIKSYRSLAQRQKRLKGILVVHKDGPKNIHGLAGKDIAFPAPRAFGATLLTRADLKHAAIKHNVAYVGTHESAYRAVARGQFFAAGGVMRSFQTLSENVKSDLQIIHTTAAAPPHIIAANKNIPRAESGKVGKALRALHQHRLGREALATLKFKNLVRTNNQGLKKLSRMKFPARRKTRVIAFHVIPRLNERVTRDQMQPLAAYLKRRLEVQVELHTHASMGKFEKSIYTENRPALINANPLQAIKLTKKGYVIIAQQRPANAPKGMRGILLVREDSPARTAADLKGKRIAFGGNKNAFFATIVPKVLLKRAGLHGRYTDVSKPGPVSDVIKRLRLGEIDAAGCGTLALHSKILQSKFSVHKMRVVAQSRPMPGLAWLVSGTVEPDLRKELKRLLLTYSAVAPGHAALKAGGVSGMLSAQLSDYIPARNYLKELRE